MMNLISSQLVAEIAPISKPRMVASDRWKKRPVVLRYRAWADEMRRIAKDQDFVLGERFIAIFQMPMPESWSKKKKLEMDGKPHRNRKDLDNMQKALMDVLLVEDSSVYMSVGLKFWSSESMIRVYNLHATKTQTLYDFLKSMESPTPTMQDWF